MRNHSYGSTHLGQLSISRDYYKFFNEPILFVCYYLFQPTYNLSICNCLWINVFISEMDRYIFETITFFRRKYSLADVWVNILRVLIVKKYFCMFHRFRYSPMESHLSLSLLLYFSTLVVKPQYFLFRDDIIAIKKEESFWQIKLHQLLLLVKLNLKWFWKFLTEIIIDF